MGKENCKEMRKNKREREGLATGGLPGGKWRKSFLATRLAMPFLV